jgi:hypothetical protein
MLHPSGYAPCYFKIKFVQVAEAANLGVPLRRHLAGFEPDPFTEDYRFVRFNGRGTNLYFSKNNYSFAIF